ncbi:molybdopterin-binding protein [Sphingomonas sp. Leaf412]|uniref:molybdopterin-dependent oxidoreductase n=1 Tax=Sphingomonas sp. Leaf412 TaxID=1736370 RepID=UPI0006FAF0CD|nr:molybdopterin-dependent oxidoreductase [Sphingomonas sp. Leaf412]KQT35090.1 molybdopterin-binding protein [Sphingomonas sp. Leaf412]
MIGRRGLIAGSAGLALSGCDRLIATPAVRDIVFRGEDMHRALQRALTDRTALVPEFRRDQMSPVFRTNGTRDPGTPAYAALRAGKFADWRLTVDGLVARPLSLSLPDLGRFPQRAQITRHDCVEGWSAIGKWQGPRLSDVLRAAGVRDTARYVVFRCADLYGGAPYYESVDMVDALHPQTILAWSMNDRFLDVGHGAPCRLRVERHLGYKHAKYLMQVTVVDSLAGIGKGRGGFWEDNVDYDWYAGI